MTLREEIVAHARRYIGVRFMHQGRGDNGTDCLGLLLMVAHAEQLMFDGIEALQIDVPNYGLSPDVVALQQKLDHFLIPVAADALMPADVVLLRVNGSPQHLAILCDYPIAGELGMIHAYAPARAVIEHRYDKDWRKDTHAAYRLPQLI